MASPLYEEALRQLSASERAAWDELAEWLRQLVFTDGYGCTTTGAIILENVMAEAHLAPGHDLEDGIYLARFLKEASRRCLAVNGDAERIAAWDAACQTCRLNGAESTLPPGRRVVRYCSHLNSHVVDWVEAVFENCADKATTEEAIHRLRRLKDPEVIRQAATLFEAAPVLIRERVLATLTASSSDPVVWVTFPGHGLDDPARIARALALPTLKPGHRLRHAYEMVEIAYEMPRNTPLRVPTCADAEWFDSFRAAVRPPGANRAPVSHAGATAPLDGGPSLPELVHGGCWVSLAAPIRHLGNIP